MSLDSPSIVIGRLEEIENDLAIRQNSYESAALRWFKAKRDREQKWASEFLRAEGSVEARKAEATLRTSTVGVVEEAEYEAMKAVVRTLETRASIGQSILRSQGRQS